MTLETVSGLLIKMIPLRALKETRSRSFLPSLVKCDACCLTSDLPKKAWWKKHTNQRNMLVGQMAGQSLMEARASAK